MTRYEKLKEDVENGEWWLTDVELDSYLNYCPYFLDCGKDDMDNDTVKEVYGEMTIGCRGITCEECWNKEYKEEE